jgi:hypothetical protein
MNADRRAPQTASRTTAPTKGTELSDQLGDNRDRQRWTSTGPGGPFRSFEGVRPEVTDGPRFLDTKQVRCLTGGVAIGRDVDDLGISCVRADDTSRRLINGADEDAGLIELNDGRGGRRVRPLRQT